MAVAAVRPEGMDTIRHEVWIGAEQATVFAAITTTEGLDAWWGTALTARPELGSVVEFDHGLGEPLRMRVFDLVPDERLIWMCISEFRDPGMPGSEWLGHRIAFELEAGRHEPSSAWIRARLKLGAHDEFTILRFSHAGWSRDSRWQAFCNTGWGVTLDGLKRSCETTAKREAG